MSAPIVAEVSIAVSLLYHTFPKREENTTVYAELP
jgi:hypothetical protein